MRHRHRITPDEMVEGVTYYATIPHIINANEEDDTATLDPRSLLDPDPFEGWCIPVQRQDETITIHWHKMPGKP